MILVFAWLLAGCREEPDVQPAPPPPDSGTTADSGPDSPPTGGSDTDAELPAETDSPAETGDTAGDTGHTGTVGPTCEICDDAVDNDADGLLDCEDADCIAVCTEEGTAACTDGLDNDGDYLFDCDDPDCWGDGCADPVQARAAIVGGAAAITRYDIQRLIYDDCRVAAFTIEEVKRVEVQSPWGTLREYSASGATLASCSWSAALTRATQTFTVDLGSYSSFGTVDALTRSGFYVAPGCGWYSSGFLPRVLFQHPLVGDGSPAGTIPARYVDAYGFVYTSTIPWYVGVAGASTVTSSTWVAANCSTTYGGSWVQYGEARTTITPITSVVGGSPMPTAP